MRENYLKCATSHQPRNWKNGLLTLTIGITPYNYPNAMKMTPFQALYGYAPHMFLAYQSTPILGTNVKEWLTSRQIVLAILKHNLLKVQNIM